MTKMFAKTLTALAFVLLASQRLFAQPVETAVPIEQEPRYRIVFQNENARIYDALIPPDDVTLFHTHSADNVTVTVSGGIGTNEFHGKPPTRIAPTTGAVSFIKATSTPYTHRVGNSGTTPLRFMVVELLAPSASRGVPAALEAAAGSSAAFGPLVRSAEEEVTALWTQNKLELENDLVKVYRVFVHPNPEDGPRQSTGIRSRTLPWVRISLSESAITIREAGKSSETLETRPGDYRWHDGPTVQSFENAGFTSYEAIEIELKGARPMPGLVTAPGERLR